ncbi:chemosensory receptor a [Plakobranchus ocellatus]|uniref:Chemosensory receptor a n=1 Tax=Plakobranchus ocellatus TaxID=259542 RepID=A0AAV3ZGW1_9GAST|nr:chemosensory receptor a [Plakobranchus ocellatus]
MDPEEVEVRTSSERFVTTVGPLQILTHQTKSPPLLILETGFLTDEQFDIISWILVFIIQMINMSGLVTNILSIIVFTRLGFSEASNISLTALAICDLTCMVFSMWTNLCYLPVFRDSRLPFNVHSVKLLTGAALWGHIVRTAAWITAFISFERCLCILVPLKVKRLITPRTTAISMIVISMFTIGPYIFMHVRYHFTWIFYPHLNATIFDIVGMNTKSLILCEQIIMVLCGLIQPVLAFAIVVTCTVFLISQLKRISSWRKSVTSAKNQKQTSENKSAPTNTVSGTSISQKEERLVRMVVVIATTFIVCFIPTCVAAIFDDSYYQGTYRRIFSILILINFLGGSVSGSVNILIYYNMASKYRLGLRKLLRLDHEE